MKHISRSAEQLKVLDGLVPEEQLEAARAERERIRAEIRELESEIGAIEESTANPQAESTYSDLGVRAEVQRVNAPNAPEVQQIESLRNQIQALRENLIPLSGLIYKAFLQSIFESGKVHFVDVKKKIEQREFGIEFSEPPVRYVKSFTTQIGVPAGEAAQAVADQAGEDEENTPETPPSENQTEQQSSPADAIAQALDEAVQVAGAFDAAVTGAPFTVEENMHRIHYILLGDIIETALKVVSSHEDDSIKNIRFAVGPISLIDLQAIGGTEGDSNRKDIPMSAIPISVKEFNNWFFNNIINRQKSDITFARFIEDLISNIIISKLRDGGVDKASGFSLSEATVSSFASGFQMLAEVAGNTNATQEQIQQQMQQVTKSPDPPRIVAESFSLPSKKGLLSNNNIEGKFNGKTDFIRLPPISRSLPDSVSQYVYIGASSATLIQSAEPPSSKANLKLAIVN